MSCIRLLRLRTLFRWSGLSVLLWGMASGSALAQIALDFGDAPDPTYPTLLASDGARHVVLAGSRVHLGTCVDAEADGLASMNADGDDINVGSPAIGTCGTDDEDGVVFVTALAQGVNAQIAVTVDDACTLSAWIDFGADGSWADAGDELFPGGQFLNLGTTTLSFPVPVAAEVGSTFARFRCTTDGPVGFTGLASDGEVEDYAVTITVPPPPIDFGDAPFFLPVTLAANGARHLLGSTVYLGSCVDAESDGVNSAAADSDDLATSLTVFGTCVDGDDEDGVTFTSPLIAGQMATFDVVANAPCTLFAWIDFNGNGFWFAADENLFPGGMALTAGTNNLSFSVPAGAAAGSSGARFRCTTDESAGFVGQASDGEVEDYVVTIGTLADFGDAPDPTYPTLAANNGASHLLGSGLFLGSCVDPETDGQPNAMVTGDDLVAGSPAFGTCVGNDDEDGVTFTSLLVAGSMASVDVTSSATCTLSAWVDFDGNGDWSGSGEDLFPGGVALAAGLNSLTFAVPTGAIAGDTVSRFRCTSDGAVDVTGQASDGEVEDHAVKITGLDFGDAPDPTYPTLVANGGASHLLGGQVFLGACIDAEGDGQPAANADGDDLAAGTVTMGNCSGGDDEDGVVFTTGLVAGATAGLNVIANAPCVLSGWIDFNADGDWDEIDDELFPGGQSLVVGGNALTITVPAAAVTGPTYARFRCTTDGALSFTGQATDGEVEDYRVTIGSVEDFGDAPGMIYPTLLIDDGARHTLGSGVYLGFCVDADADGQSSAAADGDDLAITGPVFGPCANGDDEDGVVFDNTLVAGSTGRITVRANEACTLSAWIDFDGNGDWAGAGEDLFPGGQAILPGVAGNALTFPVPVSAVPGATFARFRCTTDGLVSFTGLASDGEVEDYQITLGDLDFGDAPDPNFPTLLANQGAAHVLVPGSFVFLGSCVDSELDGQPSAAADGDDLGLGGTVLGQCAGFQPQEGMAVEDDEDGVSFTSALTAGGMATLDVVAGDNCTLSAWIDFNADGDWLDAGENLFPGGQPLAAALNNLTFAVPSSAVPGTTFARFRCTTDGPVSFDGLATDGEVEDYEVAIGMPLDFGDAPDPTFPTLAVNAGASHGVGSLYLGSCVDSEMDGQPNAAAFGDDGTAGALVVGSCNHGDDEDGVIFTSLLTPGSMATIDVTASAACTLSAWIDFEGNGDWTGASEELFPGGQALVAGVNSLSFAVPASAVAGGQFARFRCTTDGVVSFTGPASDGEVEDYAVLIGAAADYGDAPDPTFPTFAASNGAAHLLGSGVYLGSCVDADLNGQPAGLADGDDNVAGNPVFGSCTGGDDEDGVVFTSVLAAGGTATIDVTASAACTLAGWIDFSGDGDWMDAGEDIFPGGQALVAGVNSLTFPVPASVAVGDTFARFRCTTDGAVNFLGVASDGEVEDYVVTLGQALDLGDAPDPTYPTFIFNNGASHILGSGVFLGSCVDGEGVGLPTAAADGDDTVAGNPIFGSCAGGDDEDGVTFTSVIVAGQMASVDVVASAACTLSAWIDFAGDGSWAEAGDDIFPGGQILAAGTNSLSFPVPVGEVASPTFARFRCTTDGAVGFTGQATDGEVEDYRVTAFTAVADLSVTKADSVDPVIAGNNLTYTVTVANAGPSAAMNVAVTDTLPAGVTFVSTSGCAEDPVGIAVCSLGTIAASSSKQYTITVTVDSATLGTITNTASVTSSTPLINTGDDTAMEDTMVIAEADLTITKSDSVDPVVAGTALSYTVTVQNNGPSDAAGVAVADTLPAGVTFVSTTGCAEDPAGVPTCTLGALVAGASAQYTIMVTVDPATLGTITNMASVTASTTLINTGDDSVSEQTMVNAQADLSVAKTDSVDPVASGGTIIYTIDVTNSGPSVAANVVATETLPAGVTLVATAGCAEDPNGVPACSLGNLAPGAMVQYTVEVTVDAGTPSGTLTNSVTVSSDAFDPISSNDTATEDTQLDADPPTVTLVNSINDTGDGVLEECEEARTSINRLLVTFSEPVQDPAGDSDPDDVTNPANYLLLAAGADEDFSTAVCGPPAGDDVVISIAGVTYDDVTFTATLDLGGILGDSLYRLLTCGSTSIRDLAGNPLDGDGDGTGGDDFIRTYRVERTNLLLNGHFDCTIDSWVTVSAIPGEIGYSAEDFDGSSVSGSAAVTNLGGSTDFSIGQCTNLIGGGLCTLTGAVKVQAAGGVLLGVSKVCEYFTLPGCGGASLGFDQDLSLLFDTGGLWQDVQLITPPPTAAASALCSFDIRTATGENFDLFLDQAILTCTQPIFSDGFESGDTSAWSSVVP